MNWADKQKKGGGVRGKATKAVQYADILDRDEKEKPNNRQKTKCQASQMTDGSNLLTVYRNLDKMLF